MKYFIFAAAALFAAYAVFENLFMLVVRRERLGSGVKIVQLSDLHRRRFGRNNSRICRRVRKEKPDIIIISGDLVSRDENDYSTAENTLRELAAAAPVYMIYGNHEQSISREKLPEFEAMLKRTDAVLLKNQCSTANIRDRELKIAGLLEGYTVYKKNESYHELDKIETADVERLLGGCPEGEVLLIAHNPFFAEAYAQWGADYTFSGHAHGGVIRLFGTGMLSPERKLFPKNEKGIYTVGKMKLLVSAGLGKFRLFNPPEIVVYEI